MPWNGSNQYERSYDWTTDRDGGIKILADRMDTEQDGIAQAINDVVDGSRDFNGPLKTASGTVALPGFTFAAETSSGWYRIGSANFGFSIGGVKQIDVSASAIAFTPSTFTIGGNAVWHAGNDGSGSGLDADTVDGNEASAFATASHNHAASDINSGTLAHERGGLEADVSAYSGLVKINGGATSQAVAGTDYAAASHTHTIANVTSLQTSLDAKAALAGATFTGAVTFSAAVTHSAHTTFTQTVASDKTATFTVSASERDKLTPCNHASTGVDITLPQDSDYAAPVGAEYHFYQKGAAQSSFVAGTGATVQSKNSNLDFGAQYSICTAKKVAADTWLVFGDLV